MPSVYTVSREQFELRMRARRAATCLAVARSAIASGKMADAIDRLEEACALDPNLAEAHLLLEELRSPEPVEASEDAPAAEARGRRSEIAGWSHWVAAAIAICALATLAFLWPSRPSGQDGSVEPGREAPPAASPSNESLPAATGSIPAAGLAVQDRQPSDAGPAVGTAGPATPPVAGERGHDPGGVAIDRGGVAIKLTEQPVVQRPLQAVAASQPTPPPPEQAVAAPNADTAKPSASTTPPISDAASATLAANVASPPAAVATRPAPAQLPPLQRVPVVDETPVKPMAAPDSEPATAPLDRRPDVPAEATLRQVVPTDTGAIEGTLRRYADAYARLDAAAARAVWPTVDQRALARAFEGLESQGIVFEHCDVAVAGDDATAACAGRARYVPKVGSREPLVERRQWTFRLRRADAGWQITQAEAR